MVQYLKSSQKTDNATKTTSLEITESREEGDKRIRICDLVNYDKISFQMFAMFV